IVTPASAGPQAGRLARRGRGPYGSEGRPGLLQEFGLPRGGASPEDRVAVREAPEALDDLEMAAGAVEKVLVYRAVRGRDRVHEAVEAAHAEPLQLDVLGVLQRHVEERP